MKDRSTNRLVEWRGQPFTNIIFNDAFFIDVERAVGADRR